MRKKIIAFFTLLMFVLVIGGFKQLEEKPFTYKIRGASHSASDLLDLYQSKEFFLQAYTSVVDKLDSQYYHQAILDNLHRFTYIQDSVVTFKDNLITIVIRQGLGPEIAGNLQSSICDTGSVNKKFFIIDWLFG